jgi:predicted patatin/cPLA2 family phospholipase
VQLAKRIYPQYKELVDAIFNNYKLFNDTLDYIDRLETENKVFIIRPSKQIKTKKIEKNKQKLVQLYDQGYEDAKRSYDSLQHWMRNADENKDRFMEKNSPVVRLEETPESPPIWL